MSRKDYRAVAEEFAALIGRCTDDGRGDIRAEGIADAAKAVALVFKTDNPSFDSTRFYTAAGLTVDGRPLGREYGARPV